MGMSASRAAVLLVLSLGAVIAEKSAQVTDACVEGNCNAQPLKGQSILQVNSLDHSSAPVPSDLVEEEEDAEVHPRQAPKAARSSDKKRKSIKGKVLLQTEASTPSKGSPVKEEKIHLLHESQDARSSAAEAEMAQPMPVPNPMAVHEEVLVSSAAASPITPEEEQEILKHIKRAEDIGLFDKQEVKSTHPELAQLDKMEAWAKFQEMGHLGDGQKAYEKVQEQGRISEYLKAREFFQNNRQKAVKKAETRKAKANALVQTANKKSKAQLHSEDKAFVEEEQEEDKRSKFSTNVHIGEEEAKEILARIERAKAEGVIPPPTKESLESIKEQVRHVGILQQIPVHNVKAHNLALLQTVSANDTVSGDEDASHGHSGQDVLDAIAAAAEEELTAEEKKATEASAQHEKLLPPDDATGQGVLLQNESSDQMYHHEGEHDEGYEKEFLDRIAAAANANLSAAEEAASQAAAKKNRMLPPEASDAASPEGSTSALEESDSSKDAHRAAVSMLQKDESSEGKAVAKSKILTEDPPSPHANKDFYNWVAEQEAQEEAKTPPGTR